MVLLRLKKGIWLGLEDEITEETILGHRKGEGKKVEEHSDFGHSRESIRHTLHRVVPSGVWSGSSPSEMRLAPPSHSRLLTCSASPSSSFSSSSSISAASSLLSARYSRPAAPRAGWPGTVPAPAAPGSATCCAPRASGTDSKARGAGSGPGEAAPVAAGGHITGLPSVTQGSQGPLKFVEVLMTLSFADIWTGNSSGPLGFNLQGGKTLLTDTPSI